MNRLYRYVIAHDTGDAPCIDNGILTLATCKPVTRRKASAGDWVAGFVGSPAPLGVLVWAARVVRKMDWPSFVDEYSGRRDACYAMTEDGNWTRQRPDYHPHPDQMRKDLSEPVLIFDPAETWYFGSRPVSLPGHLVQLGAKGRGHRVTDDEVVIAKFANWLRASFAAGFHGDPVGGASC